MKIILRKDAKAAGYERYFTGQPCKHGHIAERYVKNSTCTSCACHHYRHPLYNTWYGMLRRCNNEKCSMYRYYGAQGITVCDRWSDVEEGFNNFLHDMGERPDGFSIDRIDPSGMYCPENCRWADSVTQTRNQLKTKIRKEDLPKVFRLLDAGHTLNFIGKEFKCTEQNIWYIKKNRAVLETGFYNAP